ncbi:6542_t:CDS:2 [Funneliformis mosseae]|uniref:6542_t:CDS:1 n=1 Tax=Funneliformis mosseae TaxID=27381 RepID=A0A9N9GSA6_FUNMO|nr:6542_t:CDS:2 [Funneliformis mosseae]
MSSETEDHSNTTSRVNVKNNDPEAQTLNDETLKNGQVKVQLSKIELIMIIIGLSLGVFLATLDQTIVSTALPKIASDFNALDEISWVATSFLLTMTGLQPTYGKFSDIFGRKETILFAIIIFEIGSLLCGLASNMISLIIFRAIAGLGGGGIISLVMIIISDIGSFQDRGKYQGIIVAVYGFSSVVGPLLGGVFTDHLTWRWAFFINLPLGAVAVVAIIFLLRMPRPKGSLIQKLKRIDYLGTIVMTLTIVAFLLPLNWGGNVYAWNSPIIIALLVLGCVGLFLFVLIEVKFAIEPVAPSHLFKNVNVMGNLSTIFFQGMVFFGLIYYIPIYFQVIKGDSATESGLELLPYIFGAVSASISTGQIMSRSDIASYRTITIIGGIFITVGSGLLTLWNEHSGRGVQISYMIITGVGVGVGGVLGIAIIGTTFNNVLVHKLNELSLPTEIKLAVRQSAIAVHDLPDNMRIPVITAYVDALKVAYIVLVPIGMLCTISAFFMGNLKPERSGKETVVVNE